MGEIIATMPDDPADGWFGESVAARYDETTAGLNDPAVLGPTVDFLAELAAGRRVLELGIGTGRVALPLAARGLAVHGIELSKAMVARLRAKPGGERIGTTIGDFAMARADGTFGLAYLVRNTIMNLTSERFHVFAWDEAHQGIDEIDVATQQLVSHHFRTVDGRRKRWSAPFRYVWPAELDLMAQLAGMTLYERWASWTREPFTNDSTEHVSVWVKAAS